MLDQLGIEMITIDLPFRLNHVNCFLAEGENGFTIIDTGLNDKSAQAMWKERLQNKEVNSLLLTHLHPDHCGYAGKLQEMTKANVSMTHTDATAMQSIWVEEAVPRLKKDYQAAAVPEKLTKGIIDITRKFRPAVTPLPEITHYIQEGEFIPFGTEEYEVIFTPGHSEGLIC